MLHKHQPKQILLSKRNYIFYVDRVKVVGEVGNVRLISECDQDNEFQQWLNVPQRNTSLLLLGHGTSITNEAMRLLAEANVIVGFCGTDGTPAYAMTDYVFSSSVDNYRPTEYMQSWVKVWANKRLLAAKILLTQRIKFTANVWEDNEFLWEKGINIDNKEVKKAIDAIENETKIQSLLLIEARWTKYLYRLLADKFVGGKFVRNRMVSNDKLKQDKINIFINHGNYLAYGIAAIALHGLGVSYAFPVLHGATRRGGLVLDIADMIKDPYILPYAFECGISRKKIRSAVYRAKLIDILTDNKTVNYCFETVKNVISELK